MIYAFSILNAVINPRMYAIRTRIVAISHVSMMRLLTYSNQSDKLYLIVQFITNEGRESIRGRGWRDRSLIGG
jgi:hypothetical protein